MSDPIVRHEPPTELPPVEPPSAKFIIQLFVIPAAIVLVLVVAYLAFVQLPFGRLANGGRDVMDYVRSIKGDNELRKWRSAQELANLLNNDARLAKDQRLLGELAALLRDELAHPDKEKAQLPQYLSLALGNFQTIKATPVDGQAIDPVMILVRALGDEQPTEVRLGAAVSLSRLAPQFKATPVQHDVSTGLARATMAEDPVLRQQASYALGYVGGTDAVPALRVRVNEDEDPSVRFVAGTSLARLGDPEAVRPLKEMLSTADLKQIVKRATATETQGAIEAIQLEALWALAAAPPLSGLVDKVRPELETLVKTAPKNIQIEAQNVLKKVPTKAGL